MNRVCAAALAAVALLTAACGGDPRTAANSESATSTTTDGRAELTESELKQHVPPDALAPRVIPICVAVPLAGVAPLRVEFDSSQSDIPTEYAGEVRYTWEVEPSIVLRGPAPDHTFTEPGNYTVKLVAHIDGREPIPGASPCTISVD